MRKPTVMDVTEEQIRKALERLRSEPTAQGSLDFCEFVVDPENGRTQGWPEAACACWEYLNLLGLDPAEKRAWLLEKMKEERDKRFTK